MDKIEPEPTAEDYDGLADAYQAALDKCLASGYEEFGANFTRQRRMIIKALRAEAALLRISR